MKISIFLRNIDEMLSECILRWAEARQRCRLLFYPPSVGIGGGRARLPPQIVAGAEASPRPQHPWRPWVAVRAARFACWMGGYLDPGVGRVFSSCSMFSSVLSLFHHTELTAFSSSKQIFCVFFQNFTKYCGFLSKSSIFRFKFHGILPEFKK